MYSSFTTSFWNNGGYAEQNKFIQLSGDTKVPAMTVVQVSPAFDSSYSSTNQLLSTTTVYQKYAILTYNVNAADAVGGTITPSGSAGNSTVSTYVSSTSGTALLANSSRNYFYIMNLATTPLFVSFGPICNAGTMSTVLAAGTAAADGKGGSWGKDFNYKGMVTVYSSATPNYIAWDA